MPSFTDSQRACLLAACLAVLYTPQHEHFGIVPLEAMAAGRPVVACNSGGPTESVLDGQTGFLCEPESRAWADAMARLLVGEGGATGQRGGVRRGPPAVQRSAVRLARRCPPLCANPAAACRPACDAGAGSSSQDGDPGAGACGAYLLASRLWGQAGRDCARPGGAGAEAEEAGVGIGRRLSMVVACNPDAAV